MREPLHPLVFPIDGSPAARVLSATLLLLGSLGLPRSLPAQQDPGSGACATPEGRQFDFWLGDWSVRQEILSADGEWLEYPATSRVSRALDGCALVERWEGRVLWFWEGMTEPEPLAGLSVRAFDPSTGTWAIHWMDSRNPRFLAPYVGGFEDGVGTFTRELTAPDGSARLGRIRFTDIEADALTWDLAVSSDGGASWTTLWRMHFTRRAGRP